MDCEGKLSERKQLQGQVIDGRISRVDLQEVGCCEYGNEIVGRMISGFGLGVNLKCQGFPD